MPRAPKLLAATLLLGATLASPAAAIVGGEVVPSGGAGPTVALVEAGRPALAGAFCGGTLVAADLVLTAAHCVADTAPERVTVVSGRERLSAEGAGERVGVRAFLPAPSADDDAVLLRLSRPVPAAPAALPTADATADGAGRAATVLGWGLTTTDRSGDSSDQLRAGRVTIRSASVCRDAYGSRFDPAGLLCAGDGAPDHCNGDSGGPLLASGNVLVGVVSFGGERCAGDTPGAYVRVRPLAPWIRSQIGCAAPVAPVAPASTPAAPSATVRLAFGAITCPGLRCRIVIRGPRGAPADGLRITVAVRRGGSRPVRRSATARRVAPGRWVAALDLPTGEVQLSAIARRGGAAVGPVARVLGFVD